MGERGREGGRHARSIRGGLGVSDGGIMKRKKRGRARTRRAVPLTGDMASQAPSAPSSWPAREVAPSAEKLLSLWGGRGRGARAVGWIRVREPGSLNAASHRRREPAAGT